MFGDDYIIFWLKGTVKFRKVQVSDRDSLRSADNMIYMNIILSQKSFSQAHYVCLCFS